VSAGHVPVVLDHDEDYLISLDALRGAEVDAVVPVHLYGLPVDMPSVLSLAGERGWWVLEDACQAHGAKCGPALVGSFGDAAAFSAYPTKNLGAWGDAGFVTGSDETLHGRIHALRHHSQVAPNEHVSIGGTERMDNLQAVVLLAKLARLDDEIARRRQVAEWYREDLADTSLDLPGDIGERTHVFHQFVVRVPHRDGVRKTLMDEGIGTGVHYPIPVHLQPGAEGRCEVPSRPERAEEWATEILSLPMYPSLRRSEVTRVAEVLTKTLGSRSAV
jgi:dTDP-4-amino-4,6-dideoxygalactose transaminase